MINYTPFGHSDWQTIVATSRSSARPARRPPWSPPSTATPSPFYKELGNQGIKATDIPVVAFSVGEEESRHRHQAAARPSRRLDYFQSIRTRPTRSSSRLADLHQESEARDQRSDGSARHRLRNVGQAVEK